MAAADIPALRDRLTARCDEEPWGEAAAVAVLLRFVPVAGHYRFGQYVDSGGVDFTAALRFRSWASGERFLIATAAGLWTGRDPKADISRVRFLRDDEYEAWLAMITAARTGTVPRWCS